MKKETKDKEETKIIIEEIDSLEKKKEELRE